MTFLVVSLSLMLGGGFCALLAGPGRTAFILGRTALIAACFMGLAGVLPVFAGQESQVLTLPFSLPLGRIILRLDPLAAVFLLPLFLLAAMAALYAGEHLEASGGKRHMGAHWFFLCLLAFGIAMVVCAGDGFLFMVSWEIMSLAPFFLIYLNDENEQSRYAAWVYLVASHLGALVLLFLFAGLAQEARGSFAFADCEALVFQIRHADLFFLLAVLGFGVKLGLMPVHGWVPAAYSAAPGHVAMLMSGAMINVGVYGLLRVYSLLGQGAEWWAWLLMGLGAFTAFAGVVQAVLQPGIRRALAYSSIENMGVICLGVGGGMLAMRHGRPEFATLAYCGALLHCLNHSLFKGLLFVCAGNVRLRIGGVALHLLGGLQKRMPLTGLAFAAGCAALCALPPFNGFAGDFLIYLGLSLSGGALQGSESSLLFWMGVCVLAAVGGLSLLCFTRLLGLAFLGEPRSEKVLEAREPGPAALLVTIALAVICLLCGLAAPWICRLVLPALSLLPGLDSGLAENLDRPLDLLTNISLWFAVFLALLAVLYLARRGLSRGRQAAEGLTWGCGYRLPGPRMQYGGGSYSQPLSQLLHPFVRQGGNLPRLTEYFPKTVRAELFFPDWIFGGWSRLLFRLVARLAAWSKTMQHGLLNAYILYIVVALVLALIWGLW